MADSKVLRCPSCNSGKLASVQSTAFDGELLESEDCGRTYEVKYGPDGKAKLVSVVITVDKRSMPEPYSEPGIEFLVPNLS